MLKTKAFLTVDCGANTLKLAEFEPNESGGLRLKHYALRSLGQEGAQEATREAAMLRALQDMVSSLPVRTNSVNVCAPGFHVFSKFVKLPPVDSAKVNQIIQYEAQQNVPFPLEEVVWDFQILGTSHTGELEVLLVAIKTDVVEGLYRATEAAGLKMSLVDVSPAALCNAFRFNYGDLTGCSALLDIGAKTSNLIFFDKGRIFSRSINIGANSITTEFASEFKLSFQEAEALKVQKGFVSLGGAYDEPDDPHAAAISKISRQVMTRLHMQVNQTIGFYRTQQGGTTPERLFLSGGASIMPYTAQFFSEKLNVPVDYFNPLRNIELDPSINLEELSKVAHVMGEAVGLALRSIAVCPVEMNLMPQSSLKRQEFNQKKPYFLATLFSLVLVVFSYTFLQKKLVEVKQKELENIKITLQPLYAKQEKLLQQTKVLKGVRDDCEVLRTWLSERFAWADLLPVFRECLMAAEASSKAALNADVGIWIERLTTEIPGGVAEAAPRFRHGRPPVEGGEPVQSSETPQTPAAEVKPGQPNLITHLTITMRAVDMTVIAPEANTTIAFELLKQLQSRPNVFDTNGDNATGFKGNINNEGTTFTTEIQLKLKHPITL